MGLPSTRFDNIDGLPSQAEMEQLEEHLKQLEQDRVARYRQMSRSQEKIITLSTLLSPVETDIDWELVQSDDLKSQLTNENMEKLKSAVAMLEQIKESRHERIANALHQLEGPSGLWSRLDVSNSHRNVVKSELYPKESTISKLEAEIDRCNQKIAILENLSSLIEAKSEEVVKLLVKTKKLETSSVVWDVFEYNESTLEMLEFEAIDLEEFYEANQNILQLIEEREAVKGEIEVLSQKQADTQNRLKNRGGQLLKEEQERKALTSKYLSIEIKLFKAATEYQNKHRKPFTVKGIPIQVDPTAENRKMKRLPSTTTLRLRQPLSNATNV
jgi:DNA repair exonuclease SbcCD ATPase subunit